jgi:hypothetical protein
VGAEMKTKTEKLKDYCDAIIADEFKQTSDEEQSRLADVFYRIILGDGKWIEKINEDLRKM